MPERTRIGRFEILERLGEGAMGDVYKARDPQLDRMVAIKVLKLVTAEHYDRFVREARTAARLQHENITRVLEFAEAAGEPYLVLELLDGRSLRDDIADARLGDVAWRARVVAQVCRGLDHAHNQGVAAHRDIKPANIQITANGVVKIMDFGIAKLADEIQLTRTLTQANIILGTLPYMSPEQIRGEKLDGRSDIWSAGIVLYELLYGTRPFECDDDDDVMKRIVLEELGRLPPLQVHLERDIQAILHRALEKNRDLRYATAAEMASALEGYAQTIESAPSFPLLVARRNSAEESFQEGCRLYEHSHYERAVAYFQDVLAERPQNRSARFNLERCEEAAAQKHREELYRIGVLLQRQREYGVALSAFEELLTLDPSHEEVRWRITLIRRAMARRDESSGGLDSLIESAAGAAETRDKKDDPTEPRRPLSLAGFNAAPDDDAAPSEMAIPAPVELEPAREGSAARVIGWFRRILHGG